MTGFCPSLFCSNQWRCRCDGCDARHLREMTPVTISLFLHSELHMHVCRWMLAWTILSRLLIVGGDLGANVDGCETPLPEIARMPCASLFAVCFLLGTRQRATLPCATVKTHGKDFAVCFFFAHGKVNSLPCVIFGTRQSYNFFSLLTSKLFLSTTYNM